MSVRLPVRNEWNKTWSHHPFQLKRKRWREAFFCASWLLTYLMRSLSARSIPSCVCCCRSLSLSLCAYVFVCYFICCSCFACKTTHFKCRLCAITQKVQFIHSSLSKYERESAVNHVRKCDMQQRQKDLELELMAFKNNAYTYICVGFCVHLTHSRAPVFLSHLKREYNRFHGLYKLKVNTKTNSNNNSNDNDDDRYKWINNAFGK